MTETSVIWLRVAAALYSIGLVDSVFLLTRQKEAFFRIALGAFWLGGLFHLVSIVELGLIQNQFPVTDIFQRLSLCAFLITVSFSFAYWKYRTASLSVFIFPLVFILSLIAALGDNDAGWTSEALKNSWLIAHIVFILLGYTAVLFTAIAAVLYLVQERRLKAKLKSTNDSGWIPLDWLPPLDTLERIAHAMLLFGFPCMTVGLILGAVLVQETTLGAAYFADPKVIASYAMWGLYVLLLFLRQSAGLRGRKAAYLSGAVLAVMLCVWAANLVSHVHRFGAP